MTATRLFRESLRTPGVWCVCLSTQALRGCLESRSDNKGGLASSLGCVLMPCDSLPPWSQCSAESLPARNPSVPLLTLHLAKLFTIQVPPNMWQLATAERYGPGRWILLRL